MGLSANMHSTGTPPPCPPPPPQGVRLKKELMAVAGEALKINVTTLGPMVLPVSEQILFFINLVARKGLGMKLKGYIPDFKLAFDHVCIHTGEAYGSIPILDSRWSSTSCHQFAEVKTVYHHAFAREEVASTTGLSDASAKHKGDRALGVLTDTPATASCLKPGSRHACTTVHGKVAATLQSVLCLYTPRRPCCY